MSGTKLKKVSVDDIIKNESKEAPKNKVQNKSEKVDIDLEKFYKKDDLSDKDINSHPVLKKLKEKLGIKPFVLHNKSIIVDDTKFDFSLTEYSEELSLFCAHECKNVNVSEVYLSAKKYDMLRLSCSIVAIDGKPLYEILGVDIELDELDRIQKNKFDLSDRLRRECAKIFCNKLMREFRSFADELENFYIDKIINISSIKAFDSLKEGQKVYTCTVPGCTFVHKDFPMVDNGKEIPFMCTIHAVPLKQALSQDDKRSLPLA